MRVVNNPLGNGKQTGVLMTQTEKSWQLSVCGGFATTEQGQTRSLRELGGPGSSAAWIRIEAEIRCKSVKEHVGPQIFSILCSQMAA